MILGEEEEVDIRELCQISLQTLRTCKVFFNQRSIDWVDGQIWSGLLKNVNPLICI